MTDTSMTFSRFVDKKLRGRTDKNKQCFGQVHKNDYTHIL